MRCDIKLVAVENLLLIRGRLCGNDIQHRSSEQPLPLGTNEVILHKDFAACGIDQKC